MVVERCLVVEQTCVDHGAPTERATWDRIEVRATVLNNFHWTMTFGQCEDNMSMYGWCFRQRLNELQRAPCQPNLSPSGLTKDATLEAVAMSVEGAGCLNWCTYILCTFGCLPLLECFVCQYRASCLDSLSGWPDLVSLLWALPPTQAYNVRFCDVVSLHL